MTVSARTDALRESAGLAWLEAPLFRIGVSSLLSDLLMQRRQQVTGACSGPATSPGLKPTLPSRGDRLAAFDRLHGLVELLGGGGQAEREHGDRVAPWHGRGAHVVTREAAVVRAGKGVAELGELQRPRDHRRCAPSGAPVRG